MKFTSKSVFLMLAALVIGLVAGCGGGNDTPLVIPPANTTFGITTASLPAATVGTVYNQTLAASNGTTPYTWAVTTGTLPAGLTLSSAGVISGTPTTAATSNFTVTVTDSTTPTAKTATKALSIIVSPVPALTVTTTSPLAPGTVGNVYGPVMLAASNGTLPLSWAVTTGTLPAGLTLSSAGIITGTPTTAATSNFTVTVTDATIPTAKTATQAFSIIVAAAGTPLSISTTSPLAAGTVGAAYGPVTLVAAGGTTPYVWTVAVGSTLPAGLVVSTGGVISGVPTTAATVSTTFRVTDNAAGTVTKALSITVNAATPPALTTLTPNCASACHGLPPTTVTGVAGLTSNMPHTANTKCGVCHVIGGWVAGTTTFDMAGVLTHNNATTNILAGLPTASCTNTCHAGTGTGLPPLTAAHPAVAGRPYVANCGICHPVGSGNPFSMSGVGTHDNNVINFNP